MHFCQTTRPITKFGTLTNNKITSQNHYSSPVAGKWKVFAVFSGRRICTPMLLGY